MGDDRGFRVVPVFLCGNALHHQSGQAPGHKLRFVFGKQLAGVPHLVGNQADNQVPVCRQHGCIGGQRRNRLPQLIQAVQKAAAQ